MIKRTLLFVALFVTSAVICAYASGCEDQCRDGRIMKTQTGDYLCVWVEGHFELNPVVPITQYPATVSNVPKP